MRARTLSLLAGGLAIGLAVPACSTRAESTADPAAAPVTVRVATVTRNDIAGTFEAGGVVQARTTALLMARILAPVRDVRVTPGDRVRAGQVLIVLDGRDLVAHARSARAGASAADQAAAAAASEQQAADAALTLARATHARISGLHAKRSATAQELDHATAALRGAEAQAASAAARARAAVSGLESARAASEAAGATESFAIITAPFDGIVSEKLVEPGNMASPGTPLLRIEDTRGFRLDVRVDESRVGEVSTGAAVPVLLDSATGGATATVTGAVTEISRAVDADARSFLVKIALPPGAGVRSGMFGRARFSTGSRPALVVPAGALRQRGQVTTAFVVDNGTARVRLVSVRDTEVLAGLTDGETVIVEPPPGLKDGDRVTAGGR